MVMSATFRKSLQRRACHMRLTFLGKDSTPDQSPTLYATDCDSYVVQGWIVTDTEILAEVAVSEGETIVEVPAALMVHLAKDGLTGEIKDATDPIVRVTASGNYIVKGSRLTDLGAGRQMNVPAHETCVEVAKPTIAALLTGE